MKTKNLLFMLFFMLFAYVPFVLTSSIELDHGINGCEDRNAFTLVFKGLRNYGKIISRNEKSAFVAGMSEIKRSRRIISRIRNSGGKQAIILRVDSRTYNNLKHISGVDSVDSSVKTIADEYKNITNWRLFYVMLPYGAPKRVIESFNKLKISVVSTAVKIPENMDDADVSDFKGVVIVDTESYDFGLNDLEELSVDVVSLGECIPRGSVELVPLPISSSETNASIISLPRSAHISSSDSNLGRVSTTSELTPNITSELTPNITSELTPNISRVSTPPPSNSSYNFPAIYTDYVVNGSTTSDNSSVIRTCQSSGSFTIFIKGLKHYELSNLFDRESTFVVTLNDLLIEEDLFRKLNNEGREFVLFLSENDLADFDSAFESYSSISQASSKYGVQFKHFILPENLSYENRANFALCAEEGDMKEVKISSKFTPSDSEEEDAKISESFDFNNFVLVDLTEAKSPFKLLNTLHTKMSRQNRIPVSFSQCEGRISLGSNRTEEQKRQDLLASICGQRRSYLDNRLRINRPSVFEDTINEFNRLSDETLQQNSISISFINEAGLDSGGLRKEWYTLVINEIFSPERKLFKVSASEYDLFHPNPDSKSEYNHLDHFRFAGRFIAKTIIENLPIGIRLSRALCKLILGQAPTLYDLEEIDSELIKSFVQTATELSNEVLNEMYFETSDGVPLIENGGDISLSDDNKIQYVSLLFNYKIFTSCKDQINAFLEGFYRLIPKEHLSSFTPTELQRLISGVTEIDVDDWEINTYNYFNITGNRMIEWFWQAVRSFSLEEKRKLLKFATGSSSVPLAGFSQLRGSDRTEIKKFNIMRNYKSHTHLPESHTCFNRIDLPDYENYNELREKLLVAINLGNGAFLNL